MILLTQEALVLITCVAGWFLFLVAAAANLAWTTFVRHRTAPERDAVGRAALELAHTYEIRGARSPLNKAVVPLTIVLALRVGRPLRIATLRLLLRNGQAQLWEAQCVALRTHLVKRLREPGVPRLDAVVWLGCGYDDYMLQALSAYMLTEDRGAVHLVLVDTARVLHVRQPHDAKTSLFKVTHAAYDYDRVPPPADGVGPVLERAVPASARSVLVIGGTSRCGIGTPAELRTTLRALDHLRVARTRVELVLPLVHSVPAAHTLRTRIGECLPDARSALDAVQEHGAAVLTRTEGAITLLVASFASVAS